MCSLVENMQLVMQFQRSGESVVVDLKSNESIHGIILSFDGSNVAINIGKAGIKNILVDDIASIIKDRGADLNSLVRKRVIIDTEAGRTIDGVLINVENEKAELVTAEGIVSVATVDISNIRETDRVKDSGHDESEKEIIESGGDREDRAEYESGMNDGAEGEYETVEWQKMEADQDSKEAKENGKIQQNKLKRELEPECDNIGEQRTEIEHETAKVQGNEPVQKETAARKSEVKKDAHEVKVYCPNPFESAVIKGDKSAVGSYANNPEKLVALGYQQAETERIHKHYKNVGWEKTTYKTAARLYYLQLNKNGLAEQFYEKALKTCKDEATIVKILYMLAPMKEEKGSEVYVAFFKKFSVYLKNNSAICQKYVKNVLLIEGYTPNSFEQALINGNEPKVIELIKDYEKLRDLGYSEGDIERIQKAYRTLNWEQSLYCTATRIYHMQLNKNGLAEKYYEGALLLVKENSDEYVKIINVLAGIKKAAGPQEYIAFFAQHSDRLMKNANYYSDYINALIEVRDWSCLEEILPRVQDVLAGNPVYLEKIEQKIKDYRMMPDFTYKDSDILSDRYYSCRNDVAEEINEKQFLEELPDKTAALNLLSLYSEAKNYNAYFAVVDKYLFAVRQNRKAMMDLFFMLGSSENQEYIAHFLPRIPVFWCSEELMYKYINQQKNYNAERHSDDWTFEQMLNNHLAVLKSYQAPNDFEKNLIEKNWGNVEKYRSDSGMLEELGYNDEEIEDIRSVDLSRFEDEDMNVMRVILAFQKNRDHLAERYLLEAYCENKIDACSRLFPILLEEKRGDLILALVMFDPEITEKLPSAKRYYYNALAYAEDDDDVFFEKLRDCWMDYTDEAILLRMLRIAKSKNERLLVKQLELQSRNYKGNEFEIALKQADTETIRTFVKNADRLVDLGYTPEEIQKIGKIFALGHQNNGMKPGQIAARVYLYQKNKNNLAERLFLEAMAEDTADDALTDAKALFQIYTAQHNHEMVCRIYDEYLSAEMKDKFNGAYAATYSLALYEQGKFREFFDYWIENREGWENFSLFPNLLYVCEYLNISDYDEYIWDHIFTRTYRADIIVRYIMLLIEKGDSEKCNSRAVGLLNHYFEKFSSEDLLNIGQKVGDAEQIQWKHPDADMMLALKKDGESIRYVKNWLSQTAATYDICTKVDVLVKILEVFDEDKSAFLDYSMDLYQRAVQLQVPGAQTDSIQNYISSNLSTDEQKNIWLGILENQFIKNGGTVDSLQEYLNVIKVQHQPDRFWGIYVLLKDRMDTSGKESKLFGLLLDYYDSFYNILASANRSIIAAELVLLASKAELSGKDCGTLGMICRDNQMLFEGRMYLLAAYNASLKEDQSAPKESEDSFEMMYLNEVCRILEGEELDDFADLVRPWTKYFKLSGSDDIVIERLRNTIKMPGLWLTDEVDVLSKALFASPNNDIYWKLFRTWYEAKTEKNEVVVRNILYQLALRDKKELERALGYSIDNDGKSLALRLLMRMLELKLPDLNIAAQKMLRLMMRKGWFREEGVILDHTVEIMQLICRNIVLTTAADYEWNSVCVAVDLAKETDTFGDFMTIFSDYLTAECAKQVCVVIAELLLREEYDLLKQAESYLRTTLMNVPYERLVLNLSKAAKDRALTDAEKEVLKCIEQNYGNALGVNDLLDFYCRMKIRGEVSLGIEAIDILLKDSPYDPVLLEVKACFFKETTDQDTCVRYYNYMLEYLKTVQMEGPVEYAVGQMVCGESYLRLKGVEAESFKEWIYERYPKFTQKCGYYQEFCDCVLVDCRAASCEEAGEALLVSILMCDWRPIFEYGAESGGTVAVLKNISTEKINVAADYYRSLIRSIALFVFNQSSDKIKKCRSTMEFLWEEAKLTDRSDFDGFCRALQNVPEEFVPEMRKIWGLDIENVTVFKRFFARYILEQKNSWKYPEVFGLFAGPREEDLFKNVWVQEYLESLDKEQALKISESYERLYILPARYVQKNVKGADYENNVFSHYLKKYNKDYSAPEVCFERYREKYFYICRRYNVDSYVSENSPKFDLQVKRQIFSLRALYYYYAVLTGKDLEGDFVKHRHSDFINTVTVALSNNNYAVSLKNFLDRFGKDERRVTWILLLQEQGELERAADLAEKFPDNAWRGYLCLRLIVAAGAKGKKRFIMRFSKIIDSFRRENPYWIKNCTQCSDMHKRDISAYLSSLENSKEESSTSNAGEIDGVTDAPGIYRLEKSVSDHIPEISGISDVNGMNVQSDVSFIRKLYELDQQDKQVADFIERWEKLQNEMGSVEAQDEISNLSIRIGLFLLRHKCEDVIDPSIMNETFMLLRPYLISDNSIISSIYDVFQLYIEGFQTLDELADGINESREAVSHLKYEQNVDPGTRAAEDKKMADQLIELLFDIADDLSGVMGDEILRERLAEYQTNLSNKMRKLSRFRQAANVIVQLIQEKINVLRNVPVLVVSHRALRYRTDCDADSWSEEWSPGAEYSMVRGVVCNYGGAPAVNVELRITVNGEMKEVYRTDRIYVNEKLPFAVRYGKEDIRNGKVTWSALVNYYDEEAVKSRSASCDGCIEVGFSDEEWSPQNVGREKFNTQFAAEGEEFHGRTRELLTLNSLYNTHLPVERYPSLLVTGLRRAGKSSVIKYFCEQLKLRNELAPLYIDGQSSAGNVPRAFIVNVNLELYKNYKNDLEGDFKAFKDKWNSVAVGERWMESLPEFFIELSELLGGRKVIFILDEMESVFYGGYFNSPQTEEQFFGVIRSLIQNYQKYVSFIFCGSDKLLTSCLEQKRESQLFQALQRIYVGRMNHNDIRAVFSGYNQEYSIQFGDEAVNTIMQYTNGLIWYTKVIAYNVLDKIVDKEHIVRDEISAADIEEIVELLISGDLGTELIDLLDNNFGAKRKAIIRAMARTAREGNVSVSTEMIASELARRNYVDNETGEVIGTMSDEELAKNLNILEKMDFIEKDVRSEDSYRFTAELYRLLMLNDRKLHKFVAVR